MFLNKRISLNYEKVTHNIIFVAYRFRTAVQTKLRTLNSTLVQERNTTTLTESSALPVIYCTRYKFCYMRRLP